MRIGRAPEMFPLPGLPGCHLTLSKLPGDLKQDYLQISDVAPPSQQLAFVWQHAVTAFELPDLDGKHLVYSSDVSSRVKDQARLAGLDDDLYTFMMAAFIVQNELCGPARATLLRALLALGPAAMPSDLMDALQGDHEPTADELAAAEAIVGETRQVRDSLDPADASSSTSSTPDDGAV